MSAGAAPARVTTDITTDITTDVVPVNDLSRAIRADRAGLDAAIGAVLDSGWLVLGPQLEAFEAEFAAYLGARHVVGVASGTDALVLALRSVGCGPDDRVVTVANAGGYTAGAARQLGALPVFLDVHPDTLQMDVRHLDAVWAQQPAAVVVTHLYGAMADVEAVRTAARRHGVPVVEDCAQAVGARRGGAAGTLGDVAAFSFYPTKNLGALGDGGAVITDDDDRAALLRSLRQYGWEQKYRVAHDGGRNSRLDEVQAAILRRRLAGLDAANERRRTIRRHYAEVSGLDFVGTDGPHDVCHLAVARLDARDEARRILAGAGIGTDVHYPVPDHVQATLAGPGPRPDLPVTERAAEQVLSVPCFPELRDDEVERVAVALAGIPR